MRRKSVDSTHIFIQFASEFQCYTEVISVVPQDISVKATHREDVFGAQETRPSAGTVLTKMERNKERYYFDNENPPVTNELVD